MGFGATFAIVVVFFLAALRPNAAFVMGNVQGANSPIVGSTVTLYAANAGVPTQLAQATTDEKGSFRLSASKMPGDSILYVIARGGSSQAAATHVANNAIALLAVLGTTMPQTITVNEFTTVASVWTSAQFLEGDLLRGNELGLRIAAGNVSHFVNLESGGWGETIQGPLNSGQTPTMANFATLADVLSGCVTQVTADACSKLFAAATTPNGTTPSDTFKVFKQKTAYEITFITACHNDSFKKRFRFLRCVNW